jgi:glycosyltransferase involved in cell wall biosynthesis
MTLGGLVCIRNGFRLGYCFQEAVQSLLPICDEVVISDCDSDDGTGEFIREWAHKEPKLTICNYPWTNPVGDNTWLPSWINYGRQHAKTDWFVYLDADEILHEKSYQEVREAAEAKRSLICNRFNFWQDTEHLVPHGVCLGWQVIRVGPQNAFFPSDYPDPRAQRMMDEAKPSTVEIMHYGFLRPPEQFFLKAQEVQRIWNNSYDPRLDRAARELRDGKIKNWMNSEGLCGWEKDGMPFTGTHPAIIKPYLREMGFNVS